MSLETDLVSGMQSFFAGRVYPNVFPQDPSLPVWPAMRYTIINVEPAVDIGGDGGDETADFHYQFDIVAKTYAELKSLREQVKTYLKTFDPPAIWSGEINLYDQETRTHRCALDYLFYPSSTDGVSSPP